MQVVPSVLFFGERSDIQYLYGNIGEGVNAIENKIGGK